MISPLEQLHLLTLGIVLLKVPYIKAHINIKLILKLTLTLAAHQNKDMLVMHTCKFNIYIMNNTEFQ